MDECKKTTRRPRVAWALRHRHNRTIRQPRRPDDHLIRMWKSKVRYRNLTPHFAERFRATLHLQNALLRLAERAWPLRLRGCGGPTHTKHSTPGQIAPLHRQIPPGSSTAAARRADGAARDNAPSATAEGQPGGCPACPTTCRVCVCEPKPVGCLACGHSVPERRGPKTLMGQVSSARIRAWCSGLSKPRCPRSRSLVKMTCFLSLLNFYYGRTRRAPRPYPPSRRRRCERGGCSP